MANKNVVSALKRGIEINLFTAHNYLAMARAAAMSAKRCSSTYPFLAMELDASYRDCMAEARDALNAAVKYRREMQLWI